MTLERERIGVGIEFCNQGEQSRRRQMRRGDDGRLLTPHRED